MKMQYLFILEDNICLAAFGLVRSGGVCTVVNYEVISFDVFMTGPVG
jgi:hypothetical protein